MSRSSPEPDDRIRALEARLAEQEATIRKLETVKRKLIERSLRASSQEDHGYGLLESNVRLAEQVRLRTKELEHAKNLAESAAKMRSAFLSTMSHEIRTPLNGVLGMTTLLLGTRLNPEQVEFAQTIRTCGNMLLDLINDILDFSRLESGTIEPERLPFDPRGLIDETVLMLQANVAGKALRIASEVDPGVPRQVIGDYSRVKQVLLNLTANAIKFTCAGTIMIRLSAETTGAKTTLLHWAVEDTGIGIAPQALERLFQPFVQADASTSRRFGGTGLGLAICRQIMDLLGGEISATSTLGKGSCFEFNFPVIEAEVLEPATPRGAPPEAVDLEAFGRIRVLVVEDNIVNQRVSAALLRTLGAVADVAAGGAEALAAVARLDYDLVLMDCQMPDMDGYEATRRIRAAECGPRRLPIVALTANAMPGDHEACIAAGMDDYLAKPVTREMLVAVLHKWAAKQPCNPACVD